MSEQLEQEHLLLVNPAVLEKALAVFWVVFLVEFHAIGHH